MSARFPVPPFGFFGAMPERVVISSWDGPKRGGVQCGAYSVARGSYVGFTTPPGGPWSLVSAEFEWTSVPDGTTLSLACVEDDGSGISPIDTASSATPNRSAASNPITFAVGEETYVWSGCVLQPASKYYVGFVFNSQAYGFLETTDTIVGIVSAVSTSGSTEFYWQMSDGQNMSGKIFRTRITLDPL